MKDIINDYWEFFKVRETVANVEGQTEKVAEASEILDILGFKARSFRRVFRCNSLCLS